jgi:1,4-dihydroxy-6-naphthoate synthase
MDRRELVIAHSPDSDDAFMFYALATRKLRPRGLKLTHHLEDIQSLNKKAGEGVYEITAISIAAYPFVQDRYRMFSTGGSIGDGYGPLVVAARPLTVEELKGKRIAVPGELTSAYLALRLLEPDFEPKVVPFDRILEAVKSGDADAGLIIHEGQLTFDRVGLHRVVDLGRWWLQQEKLPLPMGAVAVRRDLAPEMQEEMQKLIRRSVEYAMEHREEALSYALQFGRDLDQALADKFVGMWVNELTLDMGDRGRQGVRRMLQLGHERGLIPQVGEIDFV